MAASNFSLRCLGARAIRWPSLLNLAFNTFNMPAGPSGYRGTQRATSLYVDITTQEVRVLVAARAVLVVLGGLLPGFLLGLFAFRIKSRWCPRCGESTAAMTPVEWKR